MAKIDVDALAEEVTSAANIVTNGGYYEIDIDAVAQCLMRALAPAEAETAELRKEVGRLREALARLREALAETREMLGLCEQIICDETCPTTWRTADGQPHGQMHKDICDVLARHEHHIHPARSALTASEAPDA